IHLLDRTVSSGYIAPLICLRPPILDGRVPSDLRIPPMTTRRTRPQRIFQALCPVGLIAVSLSSGACAQGPETVVPNPREGRCMALHRNFVERAKKGNVDLLFL